MNLRVRPCTLLAAFVLPCAAWAAGGHHGVDDATILDPGTCEVESWATRSRGPARLVHAGASCRVGPVELGASSEYARQAGDSRSGWGLETKWAREWLPGLSAGIDFNAGWEAHERPRYQGTTVAALVTWSARDDLALHLNAGRDFLDGAPDQPRHGVSVEWSPSRAWSLTAERYLEEHTHFARAGVRWFASERWSMDFSRAQSLRGPNPSNWTVGATRTIDRR